MGTKEVRSGKPGDTPSRTYRVEAGELLTELNDAGLRDLLGRCRAAGAPPSRPIW